MALISSRGRISVRPFALVPPLAGLPPIQRAPASVSDGSSLPEVEGCIDLSEGCFVTKTIKYTHHLSHWVNATRDEDIKLVEDFVEEVLCVTLAEFTLDTPCNLVFLEGSLHIALELYAFVAITPSLSSLNDLIEMVRSDNDRRQLKMDEKGMDLRRKLNFDTPGFTKPEYELVVLHPERFLPQGSMLTIFDPSNTTCKHYFAAADRCLRESPDPSSPRLPPFHHVSEDRSPSLRPNVFLAAINAEIKFHHYFAMAQPTTPLPADVINLMRRTMALVDLLYWVPVPKKGSSGEAVIAERLARRQDNTTTPGTTSAVNQETPIPSGSRAWSSRRSQFRSLEDVDLETRIAYGRALTSGHDREYDPALFENAIPLDDSHLCSAKESVEEWQQGVSS